MSIGSALLGAVLATVSVTSASAVASTSAGPGPASHRQVAPASPAGRWAWPLEPEPEVVRRFDPPDQAWTSGHRGVDLAASVGQPVLVPTDGQVSWTGVIAGRAVVVVLHDGGLRSTFEPVAAARPVGTFVTRGEPVGQRDVDTRPLRSPNLPALGRAAGRDLPRPADVRGAGAGHPPPAPVTTRLPAPVGAQARGCACS